MPFYNDTADEVVRFFHSDAEQGISNKQARIRLNQYGPNQLATGKKVNPVLLFLSQFRSFIIYILLFAVIISIISGEWIDAIIILIILLFNAVFGFIQEYRASKAIEALKRLAGFRIQVIREGAPRLVDSKDVVPGDIIVLEEGRHIPADARIISSERLRIIESSLTGESVPADKRETALKGEVVLAERSNMVFSGTSVASGRGLAVVTATGMKTEIGRIADMITESDEQTPLQRKLERMGGYIGVGTIVICFLIFLIGMLKDGIISIVVHQGLSAAFDAARHWFLIAIALAVAAVPEGLPAVVTIALALAVKRMLKRNALIRKLPSVETLGEATVICTDKTGTLTRNEMTVRVAHVQRRIDITGEGYACAGEMSESKRTSDEELLFTIGAVCNDASLTQKHTDIIGDPTEAALLVSAAKAGIDYSKVRLIWERIDAIPFDSERKLMSTINKSKNETLVMTKGAPEHVLDVCDRILIGGKVLHLTEKRKQAVLAQTADYAKEALRVLGFAYKPIDDKLGKRCDYERKLIFVGLQGMIDPPHPQVRKAIARCQDAGIRVIMITGDNLLTAQAIAKEIGILGDAMEGATFSKLSAAKQKDAVKHTGVFARVEPAHKMRIVELLKEQGHVVAMTGDGVNDAPALKRADLGIAMGISGTDVAKESSDMVLQDDNFASIVNAIEEGRGIFENIRKFIDYLLSSNLSVVLFILVAVLWGLPLPLTAIIILWINLAMDGLPALALSVDPNPRSLMQRAPERGNTPIITLQLATRMVAAGVLMASIILAVFLWGVSYYGIDGAALLRIQTLAMTAIIVVRMARVFVIRGAYQLSVWSNPHLIGALALTASVHLAIVYTPLSLFFGTVGLGLVDWCVVALAAAVMWVASGLVERMVRIFPWMRS